jgi:hypothetical protein
MSDVGAAAEVFNQTTIRVDKRAHHGKLGWGISPNIERASPAREKKTTPAVKQPSGESLVNPPIVSTYIARPVIGYKGLVKTCRQRANELAISRLELDRLSGLPSGFSAKLLGKDDSVPRKKKMWPTSLQLILETLGLQIIVIEDFVATSRTLSRRIPADHSQQRFDNKCNSKTVPQQLAAPVTESAPASRAHLRVVQSKRRGSKYG